MFCLGNCEKSGRLVVVFAAVVLMAGLATPASAALYNIQHSSTLFGDLNQNDLPSGINYCGPTAAINSFKFLQNSYPGIYGNSLVPYQGFDLDLDLDVDYYDDMMAAATILGGASYMNTQSGTSTPSGTWADMFIYYKQKYIEDLLPGKTTYAAELSGTWADPTGRFAPQIPPTPKPSWVDDNTLPTWGFLYNNLVDGEDVEILLIDESWGHILTLTGFNWDDVDNDLIVDAGESATIGYIDPATGAYSTSAISQTTFGGQLIVSYPGHSAQLSMAVKESPVPEPTTLVLLCVGGLCLVLSRQRKRS